tara:strand:- start:898 stop:1155 length:258 start_codon:yes stop_codon:yes gene_type:complete
MGYQMTELSTNKTVHLGSRDWTGILAIAIGIIGSTFVAYQKHDRVLAQNGIRQEFLQSQLEDIKRDVERLETRIEAYNGNRTTSN